MEAARQNVYDTVGLIEAWGQSKTGGMSDEYRMELDIVSKGHHVARERDWNEGETGG
jgi:hypothetical protein